ncbi:MAG: tetratricopeptide repeat protein [Deltaproteobacteria bacterium]|nr:tetratricopeptide repeat protein [Deltaproteobacteria bacterium]
MPWGRRPLVIAAGLAALLAAVYAQVGGFAFVNVDDQQYVTQNRHVLRGLGWDGVAWALGSLHAANWHPLTWLSHLLDVSLFGAWAGGHHLVSAALHLASTLLLFHLLHRTTGAAGRSALAAALFGLHPLRAESVAWVSERKDVLSTLLLLLLLVAWVRYAEGRRRGWYLAALGLLALGLMAKPMLVTAPALLLLLDAWPLGRTAPPEAGGRRPLVRLALEKIPFAALAAASAAVTLYAQARGQAVNALAEVSLGQRVANALASTVRYLGDTLWPSGLAYFYPHPVLAHGGTPAWQAVLSAALLLALTAAAWRLRARQPWLLWGWVWFLVTLLPVIGLLQVGVQARADRYTYVPHLGLVPALVWGAAAAAERLRLPRALAAAGAVAVVLALAVASWQQVGTWRDSVTLHQRALAVTERNWNAWVGLGDAYQGQGRLEEAVACDLEAIRLYPGLAQAWNDMGVAQARLGRPQEALASFQRATRLQPASGDAWVNLGTAYGAAGRLPEAAAALQEAVRLRPGDPVALESLGVTWFFLGDRPRAEATLREVRSLDPAGGARLERLLVGR